MNKNIDKQAVEEVFDKVIKEKSSAYAERLVSINWIEEKQKENVAPTEKEEAVFEKIYSNVKGKSEKQQKIAFNKYPKDELKIYDTVFNYKKDVEEKEYNEKEIEVLEKFINCTTKLKMETLDDKTN